MWTKKTYVRLSIITVGLLAVAWPPVITRSVGLHEGHKQRNAPASSKKLKNPLAVTDENVASGRELFAKHCAVCHGQDGRSKTEIASGMKKKPTDLTASEMRGITDGEIWWVVTNGIRKSGMPAFKAKSSDQQRWQITLYVKHLMGEHTQAGHTDAHSDKPSAQGHEDHHAAVNRRGDQVMGFSHEKTTHHFRLKTDGGIIEVEARDPNDTESRDQIRQHLKQIAQQFSEGEFTAPMLIHAQNPPGVPVMKKLKTAIKYQFEETERGGRVRIVSSSAAAISAVHQFLRFQIADHKTGDSGKVEALNR